MIKQQNRLTINPSDSSKEKFLYHYKLNVECVVLAKNEDEALEIMNKNFDNCVADAEAESIELLVSKDQLQDQNWMDYTPYTKGRYPFGSEKTVKEILEQSR